MSDLKPCPFCGGDAILTGSVVDRSIMYAHCRDHKCPGWTVSRINTRYWNTRVTPTLSEAMQVPEVRALVEAATPYVSPVQLGDYAGQLRRHEALVAALAAFKEAKP